MAFPVSGLYSPTATSIVVDPFVARSPEEVRQLEIDAGLLSGFLRGIDFRRNVAAGLMLAFLVFCWSAEGPMLIGIWLVAGFALLLVRCPMERRFGRDRPFGDRNIREAFVRAMIPLYALHGGIWGMALIFSFERLSLYDQMGSWVVLACAASAPLTTIALVPALQKAYTNTLFVGVIAVLLLSPTFRLSPSEVPHYLLLATMVAFWLLLNRFGRNIFRRESEQLGLQHDLGLKAHEARAAVETKDRFLAVAAHDLRQPVMALSLYAEYLVDYPDMKDELVPKIAAASQIVKNLFESLFDLASLDSGNVTLHVKDVRIAELLENLGTQFRPLAGERGIGLRLRAAEGTVRTDSVQLQRMIGNVLGNAIKYSPPGSEILLAFRRTGSRWRVQVWDQGIGIPPDDLQRVFQEFYRVHRSVAPGAPIVEGVGLGLSIVMRLSHILQTRLHLRSVMGKGTCFTFDVGDIDVIAGNGGVPVEVPPLSSP